MANSNQNSLQKGLRRVGKPSCSIESYTPHRATVTLLAGFAIEMGNWIGALPRLHRQLLHFLPQHPGTLSAAVCCYFLL